MRLRIKMIGGVLASLFIAAHLLLWVVMSNKGPQILQESLSHYLGFTVSADRVKVSLLSQGVKIKNLSLRDPERPGDKPFFTAKTVYLRLNLFALLAKRITVRKVLIFSPSLTIWRDPRGRWILPVSPGRGKRQEGIGQVPVPAQESPKRPISSKRHLQVKFYKLDVRKGEILFYDQTVSPPFWVRLKNIVAKGQFATPTLLRFGLTGDVEAREPAAFEIGGECEVRNGKFSSNINAHLDNMDITLLAPYYQHRCPVSISCGKLYLKSTILCNNNVLNNSAQAITFKNLKFHSWSAEFLGGKIFGMSNKELVDYLEHNGDQINMDFSLSGPLEDLQSLPAADTWRLLGLSVIDQWFHRDKAQ